MSWPLRGGRWDLRAGVLPGTLFYLFFFICYMERAANRQHPSHLLPEVELDMPPPRDYGQMVHALEPAASKLGPFCTFKFDRKKLRAFLAKNRKYSDKHRVEVWKKFLELPVVGQEAYDKLVAMPNPNPAKWIYEDYPIRDP
jgi:hypothetical protein